MPALEYFMGTTSSTSALFKGTSTYSTDFSNVISRAVAIASLPIQQLTNNQTNLTSQSDELTKLDTKFTALQAAVQKIGSALGGSAFQTSVSADNVLGVTVADGAREGNYSVKVTNIGAFESSMSSQNWSVAKDPSGKPTTFTLVVGNQNYSITPADNSAKSVVNAINANYGNLVQATTVNVAPGDTRISLKSVALGQTNLDILKVPSGVTPAGVQQGAPEGYAMSRTSASWDSSGSPATYTLTIGGDRHDLAMTTGNSASEVASAINAAYGDKVRASVVDLGTSTAHDLRICLQSTVAGPMNGSMTLDLQKAGGASIQTQQTAATSRTASTWNATADAAGSRSTYNLVIGSTNAAIPATTYAFTPKDRRHQLPVWRAGNGVGSRPSDRRKPGLPHFAPKQDRERVHL